MAGNKLDNLKGEVFGLLSVVERAPNDIHGNVWWRCRCVCGSTRLVRAGQLRRGKHFHCGQLSCRFWSKVYRPAGDACWEWVGGTNDEGYGVFKHQGRIVRAHHFSWEEENGPLDDGLILLHSCDHRPCVRPDHLVAGTHADNMQDMSEKGRASVTKVHLHPALKARMVEEYQRGGKSHVDMSKRYGVSLRTVRRTLGRVSCGGK